VVSCGGQTKKHEQKPTAFFTKISTSKMFYLTIKKIYNKIG